MKRTPLRSNPEKTREWRERSAQTARDKERDKTIQSAVVLQSAPLARSTALVARAPLQRGGKLKPRTDKGKARDAIYHAARAAYIEAQPGCEMPGCRNEASDIHHARGKVGDLYFDPRWFKAVCRVCHGRIHEATGEYRSRLECLGFIVTRHRGGEIDSE